MAEYIIPNLKNACRILSHLGQSTRALSCVEISKTLNLPRTTVLRIMETLASERFVDKDDNKYVLGSELVNLGDCSLARVNLLNLAETYLARITEITGETSHLGVYSGNKVLIAKVCESPLPLHAASRAGAVVDMYCSGTGKVLLAWLVKNDPSFIKKIKQEKRTVNTLVTREALLKDLALITKRGYALDNEEYHVGVRCLAVPVWDKLGGIVGSLGITAPSVRFDKKCNQKMFEKVNAVAVELSRRLGGTAK